MKQSAGTLLYRQGPAGIEVLIVHPSGAYNRHAPWSLPKGEPNPGEPLEDAARRETREETGVEAGALEAIGSVDLPKSRKRIFGFAGLAPEGVEPCCTSWEVDRAEFVPIAHARDRLHHAQVAFLDRLDSILQG